MAHADAQPGPLPEAAKPPAYFKDALEDAERLLKYAAEIGIDVDAGTRASILQARACFHSGGTVVGLFSNFNQQASVLPLAVAFLVGDCTIPTPTSGISIVPTAIRLLWAHQGRRTSEKPLSPAGSHGASDWGRVWVPYEGPLSGVTRITDPGDATHGPLGC